MDSSLFPSMTLSRALRNPLRCKSCPCYHQQRFPFGKKNNSISLRNSVNTTRSKNHSRIISVCVNIVLYKSLLSHDISWFEHLRMRIHYGWERVLIRIHYSWEWVGRRFHHGWERGELHFYLTVLFERR